MPIAFWQDEFCTGHQQVDREHQELFHLVNSLHDAMTRGEDSQILLEILNDLARHTIDHFHTEEVLMQNNSYPGYDRHKQVHDGLTAKVTNLLCQPTVRETAIDTEITQFLTEWLAHHIKGEDQKMTRFLKEKTAGVLDCQLLR